MFKEKHVAYYLAHMYIHIHSHTSTIYSFVKSAHTCPCVKLDTQSTHVYTYIPRHPHYTALWSQHIHVHVWSLTHRAHMYIYTHTFPGIYIIQLCEVSTYMSMCEAWHTEHTCIYTYIPWQPQYVTLLSQHIFVRVWSLNHRENVYIHLFL